MKFEWDYLKAASNLRKHQVDFADALTMLDDDVAVTILEETSGEERFVTLERDALSRLSVVVDTWRQDRVRIISARKATMRECNRYES